MGRSDFSLKIFIKAASSIGMPTRFLEAVQANYTMKLVSEQGDDMVTPVTKTMSLRPSIVDLANALSFDLPRGDGLAVQTIYHEGTHAYLGLVNRQPEVAALIRDGEKHYRNAPLRDHSKGDDVERLFQEAMAEYVGNKAAAFWTAGESLSFANRALQQGKNSGRIFWDNFRAIPRSYEKATGLRAFGYQNRGWLWNRRQVETLKAISGQMKDFADRVILEGLIPDQFARVKQFVAAYKSVCRSVPGFICEF